MIINFSRDYSLRGAIFEDLARILIRRQNNNNFIFRVINFDSLSEIIKKYRLNCDNVKELISFFEVNKCLSDLVEFVLDDVNSRNILKINFYEVKTRNFNSKRKYFETCLSNHKFMKEMISLKCDVYLISIILFEDWRFSFNLYDYDSTFLRVYNSVTNKTEFFTKNSLNKDFDPNLLLKTNALK
jgi:hypothetical protein